MAYSSDRSDFESHSPQDPGRQDPCGDVGRYISELKEYAAYYASARWDGIRLSVHQAILYAILGVICLCIVGAILVMSVVLLLNGIAGGVGALFGNSPWLGDLVSGAILLSSLIVGILFGIRWFKAKSKQSTVRKYESRKRRQRDEFGHDVRERAN